MDAKKCDRCGKFYEIYNQTYGAHKLSYTDTEKGKFVSSVETMDLCLDCTDALARFLYNAEHKENK